MSSDNEVIRKALGYFDTRKIKPNTSIDFEITVDELDDVTTPPENLVNPELWGFDGYSVLRFDTGSEKLTIYNVINSLINSYNVDPIQFEKSRRYLADCKKSGEKVNMGPYDKLRDEKPTLAFEILQIISFP